MSAHNVLFARPLSGLLMTPNLKTHKPPPLTPSSAPRWETLPEPPSSVSTNTSANSTRSKRTIDEIDELDSPSTPVKKQAVQDALKTDSSSDHPHVPHEWNSGTLLLRTPTLPNSGPLFLPSVSLIRPSRTDTHARSLAVNSPCRERAERLKVQKQKKVKFTELPATSNTRPISVQTLSREAGSLTADKKRKRAPASDLTVEWSLSRSGCCPTKEQEAVPKKKKKKRRESKVEVGKEAAIAVESQTAKHTQSSPLKSKKDKRIRKENRKEQVQVPSNTDIVAGTAVARFLPPSESYIDELWPASEDTVVADEDERWVHKLGFSLGLSKDNVDVLQEIVNEPDNRKLTFLVAQHMAQCPWKIPEKTKLQFNEIARKLLLNFSGAFFFKDRSLNVWKFLEFIRAKPEKVGLDRSWTTDLAKLKALELQWQKNFSEARRHIIEAIDASVGKKLPLAALACSLDKKEATNAELDMLSLLRQLYREGGRKTFFTRVDKELKRLYSLPLKEIKRESKRVRKADAKEFPDSPSTTQEHDRKSSKDVGRSKKSQQADASELGRQYHTDPIQT